MNYKKSLKKTREILSDIQTMNDIKQGLEELQKNPKTYTFGEIDNL